MARRCKCGCKTEIPTVAKSPDFFTKKGYVDDGHMARHGLAKAKKAQEAKTKKVIKEAKAKHRADKERIKKRTGKNGHYENLKTALHYYVKHVLRKGEPCYTCGKPQSPSDGPQDFHVGHFIPAKQVDPRRFMLDNLRIQCYSCNAANSGRRAEYRLKLVEEMGLEFVEWLEADSNHKELKDQYPDVSDIKKEAAMYRKLARDNELTPRA